MSIQDDQGEAKQHGSYQSWEQGCQETKVKRKGSPNLLNYKKLKKKKQQFLKSEKLRKLEEKVFAIAIELPIPILT